MLALVSCADDAPRPVSAPPLVVEGWIEEGMPPVVMVTRAVDLTADTASFDGFVEKWARVSVFDGDKRYVLVGHVDHDYMPSFVFTGTRLRGQAGHTYRLLVETDTDTVTAEATLLPTARVSRLVPVPVEGNDTLFSIDTYLDGLRDGCYYKLFTQTHRLESRFYPAFLGTFGTSSYDPARGWNTTRGVHAGYDDDTPFSHYFAAGSTVTVKVSSIEPALFDFWNAYDSNISLSQNLFFTFASNCPSNIRGGLGYWAAYGSSTRTITLPH